MATPRHLLAFIALCLGGAVSVGAQEAAPRLAGYVAERVVVLPLQSVAGPVAAQPWREAYDAALTAALTDGGLGGGWAFAPDVQRLARRNPTYAADPRALGAQPLAAERAKAGTPLPEPFASRLRTLLGLNDGRLALVPVAVRVDTAQVPAYAELRLSLVDGRERRILWTAILETRYTGPAEAAADSLALRTAALFLPR